MSLSPSEHEPAELPPAAPERPRLPWEDSALPLSRRLGRTLASAFAPRETVALVAHGELAPAWRFALLTALPPMLLWAIIPFTHTLLFKPGFEVELLEQASGSAVALDVLRASGVSVVLSLVSALSWGLPFASLHRAFAQGERSEQAGRSALRTVLYRLWLIPTGLTLFWLLTWLLPGSVTLVGLASLLLQAVPRFLVMAHCQALARYFGASALGSIAVSIVPLFVELAVGLSVERGARLLLPPSMRG